MARPDCPKCGGTGWKIIEGDREVSPAVARVPLQAARQAAAAGVSVISMDAKLGASAGQPRVAVLCDCVESERSARGLSRARIPGRYKDCDFSNFETDIYEDIPESAGFNRSLEQAKLIVEGFAREYPLTKDTGLLLMGPCGVGKTHLAVAAAKQLIARGHEVMFYDYRELLKEIQASYNPENNATEAGVLDPVLSAEVLLLDDLGASKPSDWALETIGHILTTRYNEKRVTLITTNYLDASGGSGEMQEPRNWTMPTGQVISSQKIVDTLEQRIGQRIRSRLHEMCRTIQIGARDFRVEYRKAR